MSHQPAVLFSQNKPATRNQPAVLFSQNKPAPAISHQPNEQAGDLSLPVSLFVSAHLVAVYICSIIIFGYFLLVIGVVDSCLPHTFQSCTEGAFLLVYISFLTVLYSFTYETQSAFCFCSGYLVEEWVLKVMMKRLMDASSMPLVSK
jgi:hypothetical protein